MKTYSGRNLLSEVESMQRAMFEDQKDGLGCAYFDELIEKMYSHTEVTEARLDHGAENDK